LVGCLFVNARYISAVALFVDESSQYSRGSEPSCILFISSGRISPTRNNSPMKLTHSNWIEILIGQ